MVALIRALLVATIFCVCFSKSSFCQDKLKYYIEEQVEAHRGAIEINLDKGWHTYWKHPGINGFKPRIVITSQNNVKSFNVKWPHPKILGPVGYEYLGYDTSVFIPFEITKFDKEKFFKIHLELDYGVCKKICLVKNKVLKIEKNIKTGLIDSEKINIAFKRIASEVTFSSKNKCTLESSSNNLIKLTVKNKILKDKQNINLALIDYRDQDSLITEQTFNSEEGYATALLFSKNVSLANIDLNKLSLIFSIDGVAKKIIGCKRNHALILEQSN